MIWYRHWLELRGRLFIAALIAMYQAVSYTLTLQRVAGQFAQTGKLASEMRGFEVLLPKLGADTLMSWGLHVEWSFVPVMLVPLLAAGSGIRTQNGWGGVHPSTYYTLALPAPRWRLVGTRFLAGLAGLWAILLFSLAADCSGLLLLGRAVPFGLMALSSVSAGLAVLPVLSLLGLITLGMGEVWTSVVALVVWILTTHWDWVAATRLIFGPGIPWAAAGWTLGLTGLFLAVAAWVAQNMEF